MASGDEDSYGRQVEDGLHIVEIEFSDLNAKVMKQRQKTSEMEKKMEILIRKLEDFQSELMTFKKQKELLETKAKKFRRVNKCKVEDMIAQCSIEKFKETIKKLTPHLVKGLNLNPMIDQFIASGVLPDDTVEEFENNSTSMTPRNLNRWFLRNVLPKGNLQMYQQFVIAIHCTMDEVDDHIQLFKQISDSLTDESMATASINVKLEEKMDKVCTIKDTRDKANSSVCKASFDFVLPEGKQIRKYQEELAAPGKNGQNYIVCAPTGTGKTLIVSMVISDHLKKFPNGRVVFVVNRIALAEQQCKEVKSFIPDLRAQHITSDCGIRLNASSVFQINQMIVCTSGILLNELIMQELTSAKRISLNDITLLIFDECHNARKSNPYAVIMERYLKIKVGATGKIPQVVGLTASPGAGDNPSGEVEKSLEHLQFLCALLDALGGIKVVRENLTELVHYTNQPDFDLILTKSRDELDPFLQLLNDTMKPLEEWVEKTIGSRSPVKRRLREYKSWVSQQRGASESRFGPNERDLRSTFNSLLWYCNVLIVYHELNQNEALTFLQEFPDQSKATEHEKALQRTFENFYGLAQKITHHVENPKLQRLRKLLMETFQVNPSTKGIIFVTTINAAHLMCNWLKGITELKALVRAEAITGHKLEAGGMSRVSQQNIIDQFAEGTLNLLVSTSVLEEGLNIVACNLVVRYNHVTTEIARVQSQGRARAKGSRCYAIMEIESPKVYQEQQNKTKEDLALEALDYLPQGDKLKEEIEKIQKEILLEKERQLKYLQDSKLFESSQVTIVCRHCDLELFWGGDLRILADSHHVVITDDIFEKCVVKKHDRSRTTGDFEIARKLHCKSCDQDIGVLMKWPQRNLKFPAIKCKKILLWVPQHGKIRPTQWKDVPFIVQKYN